MKLCLISSYYPPHIGGVERYVYNLSRELAAHGHDITVVTSNSEGLKTYEVNEEVRVYRFPCYNIAKNRFPFLKKNNEFKRMFDNLAKENFDAIILNQRFYRITKLAITLSIETKTPLHLIEHVTGHFTIHNKVLDYLGHIYEHRITAYLKKYVSKAFGVSIACIRWLEHFGIEGKEVIPNGISMNEGIDSSINIRAMYGMSDSSKVVCHAGRLVEEKGILIMIEAFFQLLAKGHDVYLIISGDGPLLKQIIRLKNDRIIATGNLPHEKIMSIISQSDCVVIPSFYPEGLPTLILESGYCKTPVIATEMGGASEVIDNNVNGIVLEPKSIKHLINAISLILMNEYRAKEMGDNLHKKIMSQYTWDKIAHKLIENI